MSRAPRSTEWWHRTPRPHLTKKHLDVWSYFAIKHAPTCHRWFEKVAVCQLSFQPPCNSLQKPRLTTGCVYQRIMWNGLHTYLCPDIGFPCTRRFRTTWHWRYHFGTNLVSLQIQWINNCVSLLLRPNSKATTGCVFLDWPKADHPVHARWRYTHGATTDWSFVPWSWLPKQVFLCQNCDTLRRSPRSVKRWHSVSIMAHAQ